MVEHAAALGKRALAQIEAMCARQPLVRAARGRGLLFAIELQGAHYGKPLSEVVQSLFWRVLDKGINLSVSEGRDISITAPLTISGEQLDDALDPIEDAISEELERLRFLLVDEGVDHRC